MPLDSLPILPGFTETFPVVVEDEVGLTLRKAREILVHGWCKGDMHQNKHEKHCAVGAIRMALGWKRPNKLYYKSIQRLADSLPARYSIASGIRNVTYWNDAATRTLPQVLAQFDKVIQN